MGQSRLLLTMRRKWPEPIPTASAIWKIGTTLCDFLCSIGSQEKVDVHCSHATHAYRQQKLVTWTTEYFLGSMVIVLVDSALPLDTWALPTSLKVQGNEK